MSNATIREASKNPTFNKVKRSDSLRSDSSSDLKRVSFNNDVSVKRIPKKINNNNNNNQFARFHKENPPTDPDDIADEALLILNQLKGIECSVSHNPNLNTRSSDMRINSSEKTKDNVLYGLHALNNLDIAVNGKNVNSMPSYQEIRRQQLDSSGGSAEYSPPMKRNNLATPPKPPRKAPSMSPPSLRRMNEHHYARPEPRTVVDQLTSDPRFKRRMMDSSGEGDSYFMSTTEETSSEQPSSSTNNYYPSNRNNNNNHPRYDSPNRFASPTRTCMTDSEILRSPTEVLYAVSDKHRSHNMNENTVNSSVQTLQSELMNRHRARTNSRENLIDEGRNNTLMRKHRHIRNSQSLDSYIDDDKENAFKTRIQVVSPDREQQIRANRKPYKTTINTATDNIHYRSDDHNKFLYNKKADNEHYKVPRSKAPVARTFTTDSDHSSSIYYPRANQQQFTSTRLVKNAESRRSELDREGRSIRRSNGRTYSGCSTSPDRDGSPERYAKPRVPARLYNRSPSSSPTRPPRSKSSPSHEYGNPIRRVPSNRVQTTSRSPIKEIKRVHNDIRGDNRRKHDDSEDRLSRFTEYRGGEDKPVRRGSNTAYVRREHSVDGGSDFNNHRERGQSLPPGATIDSIQDFYKSSKYKSMYALPPSPNRPAPVLDRVGSSSTLLRPKDRNRPNRTSISEGEHVDSESNSRIHRQRSRLIHNHNNHHNSHHSPKRRAPSPPRIAPNSGTKIHVRRVISSDTDGGRRVASADRGMIHPPTRRPIQRRRQSVDGTLDSSYSESEGGPPNGEILRPWSSSLSTEELDELEYLEECFSEKLSSRAVSVAHLSTVSSPIIRNPNTAIIRLHPNNNHHVNNLPVAFTKEKRGHVMFYDNKPSYPSILKDKTMGEFGRRWSGAPHSDLDSDYRRDLATSNTNLHQEARSRFGESRFASATLGRRGHSASRTSLHKEGGTKSLDRRGIHYSSANPEIIIQADEDDERFRHHSAREEERQKVLQIEEERLRMHRGGNVTSGTATPVSRSGSRIGRVIGGIKKPRPDNMDHESQYSGHSSSTTNRNIPKINRYDQNRMGRVKRSTSNANNVGVRREIRKKMPGSVTSSLNSSESESNAANRSVYLHSAAVADIPIPANTNNASAAVPPRRTMSESRENLSGTPAAMNSNLQKSQKISRSISLLAPWKPRNYKDKFEIHYDNNPTLGKSKPPRPPSVTRSRTAMQRDKKSASSSDLLRDDPPAPPVNRPQRTATLQQRKPTNKVSRSVSMPKDTRLAGWFKKRKKV